MNNQIDITLLLNNKRIFITGGTGFLGKNLLKFFIDKNITPQNITILTRNKARFIQQYPELCTPNWLSFEEHDIQDLNWNNREYDIFIHGATSVVNQQDPATLFNEITSGTKCALNFAKCANVKHFINISSGAVYKANTTHNGLDEDSTLLAELDNARNTYAIGKIASEYQAYLASLDGRMKITTLRLFCFGGFYLDESHFAIGEFVKKAIHNEEINVKASSNIYRSYLSASDLAATILQMIAYSSIRSSNYEVYNVGSNHAISIPDLAHYVVKTLKSKSSVNQLSQDPTDISYYVPNIDKISKILQPQYKNLDEIILETSQYYKDLDNHPHQSPNNDAIATPELQNHCHSKKSISAIIACYNDAQAIPIMAKRLVDVFNSQNLDYEIIFVSNGSTDNSIEVIQELSLHNSRIIGVTHSRSFEQTSQASFLNGMELSTKDACVLIDGDLQDPPELIPSFIEKWQQGYEIVYGIREKREAPLFVQIGSKVFYRLFDKLSSVRMPHDAGDFSLIDKRVVEWMVATPEHDVLIRGMRAYMGFKHCGIKYFRPERMFGKSSNNFFKLIMWLKKGIFSYSRKPLDWMTSAGFSLVAISIILAFIQIFIRIFFPASTPHGLSTVILLIMFFGSFSILSISILGEYIAKIVEETKSRPIFIRDKLIKNGQISQLFCKDHLRDKTH